MSQNGAGRMFKAPAHSVPAGTSEIWIPVAGFLPDMTFVIPAYHSSLASAINERDFQQVMTDLIALFEPNKPTQRSMIASIIAMAVCVSTVGVLFCGYVYVQLKDYRLLWRGRAILEKFGNKRLRLEMRTSATSLHVQSAAVDQHGQQLLSCSEDGDTYGSWPPLGYSLVVQLAGEVAWASSQAPPTVIGQT